MHDLFPIRIGTTPVQILTISSLHPFPASSPDSVSLSPPCCQRDIPRTHIWLKHFPADIIPAGFSSSTVPFKMWSRGRVSQPVHDKVSVEMESKHLDTLETFDIAMISEHVMSGLVSLNRVNTGCFRTHMMNHKPHPPFGLWHIGE